MTARLAPPTRTAAPAAITVSGTISDPGGYPLAGITVALFEGGPVEGSRLGTTTTDDSGAYRFGRVPAVVGADDYRVEATDDSGAHVFTRSSVTIGAGGLATHPLTMPLAGYVQGRVITPGGADPARPVAHVCVTAAGQHTTQAVAVSVLGRFRLGGLPPGRYALAFHDSEGRYADQWYDNVRVGSTSQVHPTAVTVVAGETTTIHDQVLAAR
jgi:hypothetical protein